MILILILVLTSDDHSFFHRECRAEVDEYVVQLPATYTIRRTRFILPRLDIISVVPFIECEIGLVFAFQVEINLRRRANIRNGWMDGSRQEGLGEGM